MKLSGVADRLGWSNREEEREMALWKVIARGKARSEQGMRNSSDPVWLFLLPRSNRGYAVEEKGVGGE